jgi:hypothetical protein
MGACRGATVDSNVGSYVFADSAKVKGFPDGTEGEDDLLVLGRRSTISRSVGRTAPSDYSPRFGQVDRGRGP